MRATARAKLAPGQTCGPNPNVRCWSALGRSTRNSCPSVKSSSSRFADAVPTISRSPARTGAPEPAFAVLLKPLLGGRFERQREDVSGDRHHVFANEIPQQFLLIVQFPRHYPPAKLRAALVIRSGQLAPPCRIGRSSRT